MLKAQYYLIQKQCNILKTKTQNKFFCCLLATKKRNLENFANHHTKEKNTAV